VVVVVGGLLRLEATFATLKMSNKKYLMLGFTR
jgi:hypothetical protein